MTYIDQISALLNGARIMVRKQRIESYMCKVQEEGLYFVYADMKLCAAFRLVCMPGCCGIVISTGAAVVDEYQRNGLGALLHVMRQQMAWDMGYTIMMCTDVVNNIPQQRILARGNWHNVWEFTNRRTENDVRVHMLELKDTGVALGFNRSGVGSVASGSDGA